MKHNISHHLVNMSNVDLPGINQIEYLFDQKKSILTINIDGEETKVITGKEALKAWKKVIE